jgi:dihydrofolate synthase/folylpolyglutamate synthase
MRQLATHLERDSAIEFLKVRIDYERTSAIPYNQRDFGLDRMRTLLARLGDPQDRLAIVHVAGTKGKGSTAAIVESILRASGLRTGLYSSPHLEQLEERLRVDGSPCSADDLVRLVEHLRPVVESMDQQTDPQDLEANRPTYFEIITAMALVYFAECRVDAAVLEVGLGGRLDSTNVCQPLVSVITSISFDHMQQLGNTLAAIAGEKAAIIKPGRPAVSGVLADEPREVVAEVARQQGCTLAQLGRDFLVRYRPPRHLEMADAPGQMDFLRLAPGDPPELLDLELNLAGHHQAANAAVAIATVGELRRQGWRIPEEAIRRGLAQVNWPARVEVVRRRPTVVIDAAHNVASIEALVRTLDESFSAARRLLVFATTRDKDLRGMLSALVNRFDEIIFTRYWNNPRGVAPEELAALAGELSERRPRICADSAAAWRLAQQWARPDDLVCATGSFFLAAEMRAAIAAQVG